MYQVIFEGRCLSTQDFYGKLTNVERITHHVGFRKDDRRSRIGVPIAYSLEFVSSVRDAHENKMPL
jgi:hypothetical protein